jgi:hypothetical protein
MSVIVLVIGIVVTGLGLAALGFAIPIIELGLGATLVTAGTTALCGGLILIGLAAAVAELRRVGDLLRARPMPRRAVESQPSAATAAPVLPHVTAGQASPTVSMPAAPAPAAVPVAPPPAPVAHPQAAPPSAPAPAAPVTASQRPAPSPPARQRPELPAAHDPRHAEPAPASDVSAAALERLRSSITRTERPRPEPAMVPEGEEVPLSPNGGHAQVHARRAASEPALEPRLSPDDRLGGGTAETPKASRLDFLFRSRQPAAPRADQSEPNWSPGQPGRGGPEAAVQPRYVDAGRAPPPPTAPAPPTSQAAQPAAEPRPRDLGASAAEPASTVLKSGVVDGMAYTLYTDGSIEAKLPDGTVRFGSIADLRAHIEKNP